MEVVLSILATIAGVALSIGLTHVADRIERDKTKIAKTDSDSILSYLSQALNQIKAKSSDAYNDVMNKINALPQIMAAGSVKDYLVKSYRDYTDQAKKEQEKMTNVEATVSSYQNRLQNYALQPDSFKNSELGKTTWNTLQAEGNKIIKDNTGLVDPQTVETAVAADDVRRKAALAERRKQGRSTSRSAGR